MIGGSIVHGRVNSAEVIIFMILAGLGRRGVLI